MTFATLDMIVNRTLLEKGLPIHWYSEILFHCASAIRELAKDSLKIINSANIPLSSYKTIDLPDDFMDDLGIGIPVGGQLQMIPKQPNLNPIRIHDNTTSQFTPYTTTTSDENGETVIGYAGAAFWFWNVSDYGEPTGRYFGAKGGTSTGYAVFKERRQIQLTDDMGSESVILLYISNGQSADNATQVDWMAFRAIQAWADWQMSPNSGIDKSPEGMTWWNARRHFRANVDDLTKVDILNIVRNSYSAALKS